MDVEFWSRQKEISPGSWLGWIYSVVGNCVASGRHALSWLSLWDNKQPQTAAAWCIEAAHLQPNEHTPNSKDIHLNAVMEPESFSVEQIIDFYIDMMAEYNSKTNPHTTPAGRKQRKPSYRVSCINGQSSSSIAPEVYEAKATSKSPETGIEWILLCSFFMALAVICLLPICYFQIKRHLHGDRLSAHPERPHRHRQRQRQRQRRLHRRARSVKPQQDESANEQPSKIDGTRGDTSGRGDSQRRRGGAATQRSPRRGGRVAAQRIAYRRPPTSSSDEFDG